MNEELSLSMQAKILPQLEGKEGLAQERSAKFWDTMSESAGIQKRLMETLEKGLNKILEFLQKEGVVSAAPEQRKEFWEHFDNPNVFDNENQVNMEP